MRAKITRLFVHNYRCFVNFELQPEGRSLLVGYNGAGKSSIFDVLAAIQDVVVWNKDVSDAFPTRTLSAFGGQREQRFEIDVEEDGHAFRYALLVEHEEARREARIKSESVTWDGQPLYSFDQGVVHLGAQQFSFTTRRSFLSSLEASPAQAYLGQFRSLVERMWILKLNPAMLTGAAAGEDVFLGRDGGNFGSWCRNLLAEAPDSVQLAREALREVIPGFESLRAQAVGRGKVLVVKLNRPGGPPYEIDFDDLSDGQKVLVALYLILHGVGPRATVLYLDEPDNFVSLREIQPFLVDLAKLGEDCGAQSLIISHSPEVIDFLGVEEAILLERPDGAPPRVGAFTEDRSLRLSEQIARGWHAAG